MREAGSSTPSWARRVSGKDGAPARYGWRLCRLRPGKSKQSRNSETLRRSISNTDPKQTIAPEAPVEAGLGRRRGKSPYPRSEGYSPRHPGGCRNARPQIEVLTSCEILMRERQKTSASVAEATGGSIEDIEKPR